MQVQEIFDTALRQHQAGQTAQAERLYRQVLAVAPDHADAMHLLGMLAHQARRSDTALELIRAAILIYPTAPEYHLNLGAVLESLGKIGEAAEAYRQALKLRPDFPEACNNLGNALSALGQHEQSIAAYRKALSLRPQWPVVLSNLSVPLRASGDLDGAIAVCRQALQMAPDDPASLVNLGLALQAHGEIEEAISLFHRVVPNAPGDISVVSDGTPLDKRTLNDLGQALVARQQWQQAAQCFERTLHLDPNAADAHVNLGGCLAELGRLDEAIACFRRALVLRPNLPQAHHNLGKAMQNLHDCDQSIACFERAFAAQPRFPEALNDLGNAYKETGQIQLAIESFARALEQDPTQTYIDSNRVYCLQFDGRYDSRQILRQHQLWNQRHAQRLSKLIRPHENDRAPDRRLRIGYVSPDFRAHCQALFTEPLLRSHDPEQVEIFCYCGVARPDAVTHRLSGYADVWRNTVGINDQALADLIRAERIDILVDLTMQMAHGRPLTFARKPAPVQVAWLAYPGTTGLATMDYRLTDPYLDLPGTDEFYTEKSIRLPQTFWCYDPLGMEADRAAGAAPLPEPGPLPALNNRRITFGCLNDFAKVNERILELWSKVLQQVKDSRLRLLAPGGATRRWVLNRLAAMRVPEHRIAFVDRQPRRAYLAEFQRIDLCLDTLPYNGHTTSLDSFWMGVPVVTRVGNTVVGRAGYSQLSNLDLTELAADNDEQFIKIAVQWANDLPRLAELRGTLRQRMLNSPLTDAARFTQHIESAYRQMWRQWCAGKGGSG